MKQEKHVTSTSLPAFVIECLQLQKQGYELHEEFLPAQFGPQYECTMVRTATPEQLAHDAKPTRAEILAKARAAKAANKEVKND